MGSVGIRVIKKICEDSLETIAEKCTEKGLENEKQVARTNSSNSEAVHNHSKKKERGAAEEPEKPDPDIREVPRYLPGPHLTSINPNTRCQSMLGHSWRLK